MAGSRVIRFLDMWSRTSIDLIPHLLFRYRRRGCNRDSTRSPTSKASQPASITMRGSAASGRVSIAVTNRTLGRLSEWGTQRHEAENPPQ